MYVSPNFKQLYVIESRDEHGRLDFAAPQPESVFGVAAIKGIDEDSMAKRIWQHKHDAVLDGRQLLAWPSMIDPRWFARRKYW